MTNNNLTFNRVLGLKFLYDFFPSIFRKSRIALYFVNSKKELKDLVFDDEKYDVLLLKRSAKNQSISDLNFKDNRFFNSLEDLKNGIDEFEDIFNFCVECHKFKEGENYYSDRLAIVQFSTTNFNQNSDRVSFIPSIVPGVNTRDNQSYLEVDFDFGYKSIYHIKNLQKDKVKQNGFDSYSISYSLNQIYDFVQKLKDCLCELKIENDFQLIMRIDSYLKLLPIDLRTHSAWAR